MNFVKFTGLLLYQKEILTQVFSCEFYEICKNTFLTEHYGVPKRFLMLNLKIILS